MVLYNISKKESLKASIMSELTEVVLGGSKRFECRVLGYPRPEIRWYKDGIEITHVKRYNFAHSNDGVISMLMEDISHKDQGTYRCRADNSEGTASTSAYLFVRQRRGHVDDDTVSVHSMTLSEVDKDYEDRQIEFESIAKRMQMDFCDEDEFIQKKTFEDIVSEEGREKQINSQYAFDAVRKEKYESSMSNGYYEEECSSQKITSKEEFQSETISEVHIYEESKSSTISETTKKSSTTSKQSSKTSALESSMNSEFGPDSGFDSISASMKQDSSLLEIEATFSSSEIDNQSIITAESSLDNTTTTNSSKSKTDEEQSPSLLSSNVEVNETETSSSNETIVKTESSVDNVASTPQSDKDNMNMTTKIEVEEKTASTKSKSETVIESETSISSSSLEVKEEKSLTITSTEVDIEEQKRNEGLLVVDHDVEVQNGNNSKDGEGAGLKLESSCVDIQQAESQETTNGSLLVDHSVEIESSKFKRKKRMSVEMEVEEKRSEDFSVDSKTTKAKKIADMKTMTAEMMTMSKDNVPTDMGSVSSIFSLVSEEGVEESSVPLNPSEILEAKLRNKIQSSVKEIDVASELDNVDDSVFVERNEESLKETTSTAQDEKTADLTESRIQRTLSQTEEQLESASSTETTEKLKSNTPDAETHKAIEITEDIEHNDTAKPVEREPVFVDEQNILSDDAQSVSNVDSVSSEDLSISSQIDVTELTKAKAKQEAAHADELLGGKDDVSVVSDIPDVESVEAEQLSTDGKEVSSKKQSEKETTFVDEMLSRDDVSVVSDVTDVDTAVADESAVSVQTGIPRVSSDTSLHVEQMSVAGSEISELEVDDNVPCSLDVTEEEDSKKCLDQQTREKMMVDEMEAYCKEETSLSSLKSNEKEEASEQKVESQLLSKDSVTVGDEVELLDGKLVDPPSPEEALDKEILEENQIGRSDVIEEPPSSKPMASDQSPEIVEARSDVEQDLVFTSEIETSEFRKEPDEVEQKLIVETSVSSKSDMIIDTEVEISDEQYSKNDPTVIATSVEETKLYAPEVVRVPDDTSVECGETVHLIAEVKGNPNPDVKWFKEGEKVCENQRVTLVTEEDVYSMEIRKAESSDSGTYTLTAHNTEGTIFSDVHVKVLGASGEDNSGQNISIEAKLTLPKFTKKPESSYTVSEFDPVQFVCEVEGDPEPEVIWMKEGQRLKSDQKRRIYKSDGQHYLEIPQSSILDAGEYECHATNSEGSAHCYISLVVEAATEQESGLSAAEEVQPVASESDELFLQEHVAVSSYVDEETHVSLAVGDIVQVLDSKLTTGHWLVRKQSEREQVCYVPSSILQKLEDGTKDMSESSINRKKDLRLSRSPSLRLEHDLETSEDEAGLFHRKESYEIFMVVADYNNQATDPDSLRLAEGQYVEVIDKQRPDLWLVRTKPTKNTPAKHGWVPSAYFEVKMAPLLKKDPRESFRDEILHIKNKQQEAMLKRSPDEPFRLKLYLLTELIETEREYIRDLQHLVETYESRFTDRDVPDVLRNKHDEIFSNIKLILKFHHDQFLNALTVSSAFPGKTGGVFLKFKDYFMMYSEYLYTREAAGFFLDTEAAKAFYKKYSRSIGESENNLPVLLSKCEQRLCAYLSALKDFLRLSQRANDSEGVKEMEKAVAMINEIYKRTEQRKLMEAVEGYTGDVNDCGPLLRHDDVALWDVEPGVSRCKERHMHLFPDKLVLTKRKRPDSATETINYTFKSAVQLQDIQIFETLEEDERRFEIWYVDTATEKFTIQTRSAYAKQAWVKDIRETLVNLGVTETDITPEERQKKQETSLSSATQKKMSASSATEEKKDGDPNQEEQSGSDSDKTIKTDDYQSYDSDYNTDISSYHTAPEFEDGSSRPIFKRRPKETVCSEGSSVKLECIVGGVPTPTVEWLKDNVIVEESANCTVLTEGESSILKLDNVNSSCAGQYSVKATNKNATVVCSADLVVLGSDVGESVEFDRETTPTPEEPEDQISQDREKTPVPELQPETKEETRQSQPQEEEESVSEVKQEPKEEPLEQDTKKDSQPEPKEEPTPVLEKDEPKPVLEKDERKPEPKEETKQELKEEPKSEPKEEPQPERKEEKKPKQEKEKPKPEEPKEKSELKEEPKPELKADLDSKEELKPEPKEELKPESKPEPISTKEPEPATQEKPKPEPKEKPKQAPQEPKPEPKEEAKPEPKEEPKQISPKEPKPKPKEEPKPEPEAELTPGPTKEVEPAPKKEKKLEPKEESKEVPQKETEPERKEEPKSEQKEELKSAPEPKKEKEAETKEKTKPESKEESKTHTEEESKLEAKTEPKEDKPETKPEENKLELDSSLYTKEESETEFTLKQTTDSAPIEDLSYIAEEKPENKSPIFVEKMKDCDIQEGRLARFDCRVCAYPIPEITWEKDGQIVEESGHYKLLCEKDEIYSLLIKDCTLSDSGRYTCWARNEYGEAYTESILNVIALDNLLEEGEIKPAFVTRFYDVEVTEGVPAEFVCQVKGEPAPTVQWFLNGEELKAGEEILIRKEDDGHQMLAFRNVRLDQAGEVICKLKNGLGDASCTAQLIVKEDPRRHGPELKPPKFIKKPVDCEVSTGEDVKIECTVAGEPEPDVTWFFEDRELFESHRRIIRTNGNNHTLKLRSMAAMNTGVYTIRAVNVAGETSCTFKITVNEIEEVQDRVSPKRVVIPDTKYGNAPSFASRIQDARAPKGGKARFECRTMGIPQPEVVWFKDGSPVLPSDRIKMGRDATGYYLTVSDISPDDEGEYSCNIKNDSGKASCSARLTIGEPLPATDYKYKPASEKRKISPLFDSLDAAPVVKRSFVELAPDDKVPTMPVGKPSLLEVKADAAKLSWLPAYTSGLPENAGPVSYTVEARELPGTYWSKLATDVYGTTYFARQLRPDKEYQFRVRAENRYGSSEPSVPARLAKREEAPEIKELLAKVNSAPPVMPSTHPYLTDIGRDNVRLAWKPVELETASYELPDVTYSIEAQKLPSKEWVPLASRVPQPSYFLSDLDDDRDYNIRISAENKHGRSAPTESLWLPRATTFPGVPVSRPSIVEMEPDSVRLSWTRVDIPAYSLSDEPLRYMIEMQEPPALDWQTIAQRLPDTSYKVTGLSPRLDYRFRVRPVTESGTVLEPSPPASLFRTLVQSHVPVDHVHIDDYEPDLESLRLSWRRVEIPPFDMEDEPLLYMIEQSDPRGERWRPVVSGLPTTSYRIPGISQTDDMKFRVRAITPYGLSPPSHDATLYQSVSPVRTPVESLKILDMQPEKLRLAWQPPVHKFQEPISYQIESQHLPSLEWKPVARDITDTSYMLSGLLPSQDYRLRVRPHTPSGYLDPTEPVAITSHPVRPRLPVREPSVGHVSPTSVELTWRPAEIPMYSREIAPISYSVDMQEYPSSSWIPVARNIMQPHYLVSGLKPDSDYAFRIRPETTYGPGEVSLPVQIKRKPVPALPQREPIITNVTPDSCELSWSHIDPLSGSREPVTYIVEIKEPSSNLWKHLIGNVRGTNLPIRFLNPDKDYLFRIMAESGGLKSEPSPAAYLPHRGGPPRLPTNAPFVSDLHPDSLVLSWRSVELPSRIVEYSPVRYVIEAQESPLFQWKTIAVGVPRTQYHVTGLKPDRDYIFRVRAESSFGLSEPTETITVNRRPVLPALSSEEPMMTDIGPTSVRLSWRRASIPAYMHDTNIPVTYTIFGQESPSTNWHPLVRRVPETSYTVRGLLPDRDYAFRVQAENDYGTSKPTLPVKFIRRREVTLPVEYPEIDEYEPSSLLLSWRQPSLPASKSKPLTYALETYEPVGRKWVPYATKIPDTKYRMSELAPTKDYVFRVRPEIGSEPLEPSMPISFSPRRMIPSVPVEKPEIFELEPDSVHVSWHPVRLSRYNSSTLPQKFRLEMRDLNFPQWTTVVYNTSEHSYRVRDLDPDTDYAFRVRGVTDDGVSEPSPAVFLHRRPVISRAPITSPEITTVEDTSVALGWQRVNIPAFDYDQEPMTFLIEAQRLPDYNWRPLARGLTENTYKVKELDPYGDYHFRIRGESSMGLTEPSPVIPFYRQPVRSGVPIARTSILDENATTARLQWTPAYIPNYTQSMPRSYVIEKQESPSKTWRPLAKGVTSTDYTVTDLSPRKDYHFRIRAVTPTGGLSSPTPPIPFYRTQLLKYVPVPLYESPFVREEYSVINHPYIESLTTKVPPRMSIEKPDMVELSPETIRLSWNQARVPERTKFLSPTIYRIEVRQPNSFDWREVVGGITGLTHTVQKLNPMWDYAFRVRAINDFGLSEPTLPVFLNRQTDHGLPIDDFDYDTQFGESVPPKLPIDTPVVSDVLPERLTLKWFPARIPAYAKKAPITYTIEVKEPVAQGWRRMVSDLTDPYYEVRGLTPKQDYSFRIRAESPFGVSEPTLPVNLARSKAPVIKRTPLDFERDRDLTSPARSYIDSFTSGVPPRVPAGRPNMTKQAEDRLLLSWQQARMPSYLKNTPITYIVEMREPPSHAWTTLVSDLPETHYEVSKLRPEQDYMFRVRAKNEFGMSEPTLPATLFRERDEPKPKTNRSGSRDSLSPFRKIRIGTPLSRERSETVERKIDYTPSAPEFLTPPDEDQYAAESRGCKICMDVKGFPLPTITWFFKGEKLEMGGRYNTYVSPVGQIDLEFSGATWEDIGDYKCLAENEHGSAVRVVPLKMADPPTFIEPLKDVVLLNRGTGKLECRVDGIPYPTIKFNKDWRPLTETSRVHIQHEKPDYFSLTIDGSLSMDAGQYTCVAENVAGKIFCSARLEVEDSLPALCDLNFKNVNIEDYYYVMEELGRGRHAIMRRVIEKSTGRQFAAKFITVRDEGDKDFFKNELETLRLLSHKNIVSLHDAYETPKNLIIVTELLSGGDVIDRIVDQNNWTENDVAGLVKQLLETLDYLHKRNILHLDIKPSNILYPSSDSGEIKLIDFGFARKIPAVNDVKLNYGTPEFSSPEAINNEPITTASDIWSLGTLIYTLLSGVTPFQSDNDPETLEKVMTGDFTFGPVFDNISKEAKDLISKLLVVEPTDRLSLEECLNHSWIKNSVTAGRGLKLDNNNMKSYRDRVEEQRKASAVKTVANLRSLRCMMDGDYSDLGFQPKVDPVTGLVTFPDSAAYGEFADADAWYDWQARNQQDAQLRTTQDTDYGLRVRGYRRAVGDVDDGDSSAGAQMDDDDKSVVDEETGSKIKTMKERRMLSLDREEIPSSIEREIEWLDGIRKHCAYEPTESTCTSKRSSISSITGEPELPPPMFTEKLQDTAFSSGEDILFKCRVVGPPPPSVTWYRNEELLTDGARIRINLTDDGVATLVILSAKPYDGGVYKCVARNKYGRVTSRARLLAGDVPNRPGRPVVTQITSDSALVIWEAPKSDGNSDILYYKVDYKKLGDIRWTTAVKVLHECAVVTGLNPDTGYRFRVSCMNQFGLGPYSWSSVQVTTKEEAKGGQIYLDEEQKLAIKKSHEAEEEATPSSSRRETQNDLDLSPDTEEPTLNISSPSSKYQFTDSIWSGKFSNIQHCTKSDNNLQLVAKTIPVSSKDDAERNREYSILRSVRHVRIARLFDAYFAEGKLYLIFERLYGDHIVRQLAFKRRYSEENVACVIRQVLHGLQFLHRMGIAHLNIQPGSVVTISRRHLDVKLVDFSLAQKIPNQDGIMVPRAGYPDFIAPEIVAQEPVTEMADIWGVAALTFLLLSGESAFSGETDEYTLLNIVYNRYDAHDLYDNISKEALKFIFKVMKRLPKNRLSLQDCLEHKWLQVTDTMVKTRQEAVFLTNKLRKFCKDYDSKRLNPNYRKDFVTFTLPEKKPVKRVKPKSKSSKTETSGEETLSEQEQEVAEKTET